MNKKLEKFVISGAVLALVCTAAFFLWGYHTTQIDKMTDIHLQGGTYTTSQAQIDAGEIPDMMLAFYLNGEYYLYHRDGMDTVEDGICTVDEENNICIFKPLNGGVPRYGIPISQTKMVFIWEDTVFTWERFSGVITPIDRQNR